MGVGERERRAGSEKRSRLSGFYDSLRIDGRQLGAARTLGCGGNRKSRQESNRRVEI